MPRPQLAKLAQEQLDKEERKRQEWLAKLALEMQERDRQFELEKLRLEVERVARDKGIPLEPAFNISAAGRLLPQFNEDVDVFFESFERVATELTWPRPRCSLLVQRAVVGKAQHAFAALDGTLSLQYDAVKKAVLTAYRSVPDEYRRKFRSHQRRGVTPGRAMWGTCELSLPALLRPRWW
ncbi:hypothetical protein SKAU_G00415030 [Synaphobranchus kaupii]|uniref:Uncharacterized protein n=1 Tax=Synaphobranchus kaupii TaxID=118154 RepID=A0A9Q1IAL7_SYNKA|nr:hypothetical protein SKAU_G00415030 [Synaphobranchus kaupii]